MLIYYSQTYNKNVEKKQIEEIQIRKYFPKGTFTRQDEGQVGKH